MVQLFLWDYGSGHGQRSRQNNSQWLRELGYSRCMLSGGAPTPQNMKDKLRITTQTCTARSNERLGLSVQVRVRARARDGKWILFILL